MECQITHKVAPTKQTAATPNRTQILKQGVLKIVDKLCGRLDINYSSGDQDDSKDTHLPQLHG